jgi:membrane protein required for colicin V production
MIVPMAAGTFPVSTPDAVVAVVTLLFALRGAWKGFVWQLLRLAGLLAGLVLAARIDVPLGRFLARTFSFVPADGSDVVGWTTALVAVYLLAAFGSHLARDLVREARLGGPDRFLGGVLGGGFGFGVCAVVLTLWASTKAPAEVERTFAGSVSAQWIARTTRAVTPLFPAGVRERWAPVLRTLD